MNSTCTLCPLMLNLTSTFGGGPSTSSLVDVWTPLSRELGDISEIYTPRLNLVGKYSSELWASKQAHRVAKPPAHARN